MASTDTNTIEASLPELPEKKKAFLQSMAKACDEAEKMKEETLTTGYGTSSMFNNKKFSDLQVKLNGSEEVYHIHRAILASNSVYFEQLLEGNARLSLPDTALVLQAPDELQAVYADVIEFLYTGKVTVDKYTVFKYYYMAELISCQDLYAICTNYLTKSLKVHLKETSVTLQTPGHTYAQSMCVRKTVGNLSYDINVSNMESLDKTYTAAEILSFWTVCSEQKLCDLMCLWIAAQLKNDYTLEDIDLTSTLTFEQARDVLDCDVQPASLNEFSFFTFATQWLDKHEGEHTEDLLMKIRYAFLSRDQRDQVLQSAYVTGSQNATQAVAIASFYFEKLLSAKQQLDKIAETFLEFQKKVYKPRKYQSQ